MILQGITLDSSFQMDFQRFSNRDLGDLKMVTKRGCMWLKFDVGDIFWMLVPDANDKT